LPSRAVRYVALGVACPLEPGPALAVAVHARDQIELTARGRG
jgi:hypothetical protein